MIRKVVGSDNKAVCFGVPLLLKPDGSKFGKSEGGSVFLDPTMTSPYKMYQFCINQPDDQIDSLLKRCTFLPKDKIIEIVEKHKLNPELRHGQKILAEQLVKDIHGEKEFNKCLKISETLFSSKFDDLTSDELFDVLKETKVFVPKNSKYNIIDILIECGICKSKSEGRKLVEQKAIHLNGNSILDANYELTKDNSIDKKFSYIQKGKKEYILIDFSNIK
jgi:tyrosyl-tRNA synthetase